MKSAPIKTAMVNAGMKDKVYKISTESDWTSFQESGQFKGSADDLRDGFIHLSKKEQVSKVIERFFLENSHCTWRSTQIRTSFSD